jgi:hypothetical protein
MPTPSTPATIDRVEIVHAAIVALGEASAAEIARQAGMAYSTVTPKLRALDAAGRAEFVHAADGTGKWRPTTPADPTPTTDPSTDPDPGRDLAPGDANHTDGIDTSETEHSGPPVAAPAPTEPTETSVGDPISPTGDGADTPATDMAPPVPADDAAKAPRRPKGAVTQAVLSVMRARPDATFKPAQLGKQLGISQGAIANALHKLAHEGSIVQVVETPATFQAV